MNAEEVKPTPGHADWHDLCDQPARLTEMLSLSDAELGQRLGQPGARERFRMVERQDEFHVALQNYYPLTDEVNADVEIEEWTYAKGDARLTIWLHRPHEKWVMLEHLCWSADMEF